MYQNKILVGIFLPLVMLSIFGNSSRIALASPMTSLSVSPSTYTATSVGETVPIQVGIFYVFNLTGFQFQLRFNTTLLRCLNAAMGSFFPGPPNSSSTITIDNTQGIISIAAHLQGSGTPVNGGFGTLLQAAFNATYATPYPQPRDTCTLQIANDILNGTGNPPQPIPHGVANGTYLAPYIPPQLNITLTADKIKYNFEGRINVNGAFTGNGYPIPDALVALEMQGPNGAFVLARTFQTSSIAISCPLQITALTPSDALGDPQSSFSVGSLMYFYVAVKNTGSNSLNGLLAVNPFDSSNSSLGVISLPITVPAGSNTSAILGMPLQYGSPFDVTPATSGNATVYASFWSAVIENGGTPLALEAQATFTITGTSQGSPIFTNPPPQGTYQANFAIHYRKGTYSSSVLPNYMIYVEGTYMGNRATQSKQTQVTIAGDVNVDGKVDLADLVLLAVAYGSKPGDPKWNPKADINGDGIVGLSDLVFLAKNYGKGQY
jgi:hypothetical protein